MIIAYICEGNVTVGGECKPLSCFRSRETFWNVALGSDRKSTSESVWVIIGLSDRNDSVKEKH